MAGILGNCDKCGAVVVCGICSVCKEDPVMEEKPEPARMERTEQPQRKPPVRRVISGALRRRKIAELRELL